MRQRLLRPQAVRDLVRERDLEWIALDRSAVLALRGLDRSERALVPAAGGLGEATRLRGGRLGALRAQAPVAGEPLRAADERADAEPFALDIVEPVDPAVARSNGLGPAKDDPRIGVGGACGERRGDRLFAELAHGAKTN